MSMWGRAAAGAGKAASEIANKYIDNEVATARAQAIADIQRASGMAQLEDADKFRNDPARVARDRANKTADITAEGTARNALDLAGKRAVALDPQLRDAEVERSGMITGANAKASATANADAQLKLLGDPKYIEGLRQKAAAERDPNANAGSLATAALARFQLGQAQKIASLQDTLSEAVTTGNKGLEEQTREQIAALSGKDGKATEFYKIAESAGKAMAPAVKTLADPMATEDAKAEAKQMIREQRALMTSAAKRAGVNLEDASKEPQADVHVKAAAAIKAGASAEAVNKKLAEAGYAPLPTAEKKPPTIMERAAGVVSGGGPATPAQEYVPPENSVVGQARAKMAEEARMRSRGEAAQSSAAAQAYATLAPGDRVGAAKLQSSPLFGLLTPEQQRDVYARVNSR